MSETSIKKDSRERSKHQGNTNFPALFQVKAFAREVTTIEIKAVRRWKIH